MSKQNLEFLTSSRRLLDEHPRKMQEDAAFLAAPRKGLAQSYALLHRTYKQCKATSDSEPLPSLDNAERRESR
jgi:hypothetical protein